MGFLSDLGNVLHAIGSFVSGGDNDPNNPQNGNAPVGINALKKPQQQQPQAPVQQPTIIRPTVQQPPTQATLSATPDNGQGPVAPQLLIKANQPSAGIPLTGQPITNAPITTQPAVPTSHPSFLDKVGHVVSGVGKTLVSAPTYFVKNDIVDPARELTDQATGNTAAYNQEMADQNVDLGLSKRGPNGQITGNSLKGGLETLAGNTAQLVGAVAAPGVDSAVEGGVESTAGKILPSALTKVVAKGASGAVQGAGFNAAGEVADQGSLKQDLEAGAEGAAIGGAGGVVFGTAGRLLNKANTATDTVTGLDSVTDKQPDEVAVGLKSVNPTQVNDAVDQGNAKLNEAGGDNTPAYQRGFGGPSVPTAPNLPEANPTGLDVPTFIHNQNMQNVIDQGNSELNDWAHEHPDASPQEIQKAKDSITQQVTEAVNKMQKDRATALANQPASVEPKGADATPTNNAPEQSPPQTGQPLQTAQTLPTNPSAGPAGLEAGSPVQPTLAPTVAGTPALPASTIETPKDNLNTSSPNNVAQTPNDVNPQSSRTAPNAPNVLPALNQHLSEAAKIIGDPKEHDVFSNPQLNAAGEQVVAQTPVNDLLNKYSGVPVLHTAEDASLARAAIMKLAPLTEKGSDEITADAARTAMANIAEALSKGVSGAGRLQNYYQSMLDSLPRQIKVPFVINSLDKLRAAAGMPLIKDDLQLQNEVTTKLDTLFASQEQIKGDIAAMEDHANGAAVGAQQGVKVETKGLQAGIAKAQNLLQRQNGEIVKYYQTLVPGSSLGQKINALQRTMMLTSPTGRANTIGFAGANTLNQGLQNVTQGVLAKVVNRFKPGAAIDTLRGATKVVTGAGRGLVKTGSELKGADYVSDTKGALEKGNVDQMSNLRGGPKANLFPRLTKVVKTITHSSSNLTEGVRDQRLYQLGVQEGQKQGLTGDMLNQYAEARSAVPNASQTANATNLWQSLNHMNDNPVSRTLNKISSAIDTNPNGADSIGAKTGQFVMGAIKNQVLPFTSFLGGNIYNSITDKNVVAAFTKLLYYAGKGDTNGIVENLAKTANNAAYTYALGYLMTKSGMITNTDANGYSDSGAYLHIGSHYIPVNDLGFFSPSLILGNALYQGVNSKGNGIDKFGKTLGASIINGFKSTGGASLTTDNTGVAPLQTLVGNGTTTPGSASGAAAQAGGGYVNEFLPAANSDINAVLNRYTSLDPSREAALTKVTKGQEGVTTSTGLPSTAKAPVPSEINTLLNKIPIASQALPRNPGVAAPDLEDRVTRGSHQDPAQIAALAKAKAPGSPEADKIQLAADKKAFTATNKPVGTVNGVNYANINGTVKSYATPMQAQQAVDYNNFKNSGKSFQSINGMVYQKGSDGKYSAMEQKDYDYKTANDQITSSKNSGDVTGYTTGISSLLGNISWQLQHATLTDANRATLTQKAVQEQESYAEAQAYGGFSKPTGTATFKTPQITGAAPGYVQSIQEAGAKYGVDINALLSVAAQEGLGGGVGDNGTSFGPFQLHVGGELPPGQTQAWAESQAGIDYAVQKIAQVTKGLTGQAAINAIVDNFEKPANPTSEAANAIALYTGGSVSLTSGATGGAGVTSSTSSTSASTAAKDNTIRSIPVAAREDFTGQLTAKPIPTKITQIKLTPPGGLIKAHKISVHTPTA